MNNFSRYMSLKSFPELSVEAKQRGKRFFEKAVRGAVRRGLSEHELSFLRSLNGATSPLPVLLGSDRKARYAVMRRMYRALRKLLRDEPDLQFLFITVANREWDTSDERTRIPLRRMQAQIRRIMQSISPDWLGVVELQVYSNVRHRRGGKRASNHGHMIVFGRNIEGTAWDVAERWNARISTGFENCPAVDVQRIGPTLLDLGRVVRYLWKSPDRCKNRYVNPAKGIATFNESEAGDRYIRYLRMFQLQSMLQIDTLLFGSGRGARIRAHVLRQAHNWREAETGRRKRADVMDEVGAFWASFMPRLGHARFRQPRLR